MRLLKLNYKHYFGIYAVFSAIVFFAVPAQAQTSNSNTAAGKHGQPKSHGKHRKKKIVNAIENETRTNLQSVSSGAWGAAGINLTVAGGGGQLEFDCAEGEITQKLMVDGEGNFTAEGIYIRRSHGPIRVGFPPVRQAVRYEGRIFGAKMNLKIVAAEDGKVVGEYTLESGVAAKIHRCY